jgi:hypothetical protein
MMDVDRPVVVVPFRQALLEGRLRLRGRILESREPTAEDIAEHPELTGVRCIITRVALESFDIVAPPEGPDLESGSEIVLRADAPESP